MFLWAYSTAPMLIPISWAALPSTDTCWIQWRGSTTAQMTSTLAQHRLSSPTLDTGLFRAEQPATALRCPFTQSILRPCGPDEPKFGTSHPRSQGGYLISDKVHRWTPGGTRGSQGWASVDTVLTWLLVRNLRVQCGKIRKLRQKFLIDFRVYPQTEKVRARLVDRW